MKNRQADPVDVDEWIDAGNAKMGGHATSDKDHLAEGLGDHVLEAGGYGSRIEKASDPVEAFHARITPIDLTNQWATSDPPTLDPTFTARNWLAGIRAERANVHHWARALV